MNTADLIERVAAERDVAKEHVRKILDSAFAAIVAAVENGEDVALSGFGRFKLSSRAARQGRNPVTGATIEIPASRKLAFTAAKSVRNTLNHGKSGNTSVAKASVEA
jgi:DNA-binding protein HU-beta